MRIKKYYGDAVIVILMAQLVNGRAQNGITGINGTCSFFTTFFTTTKKTAAIF